jgi:energy-coupling factor transporter ATP-binding protein EcfA2
MQDTMRQDGTSLRAVALGVVRRLMPTSKPSARAVDLSHSMSSTSGSVHTQTTEIMSRLKRARIELESSASAAMTLSPAIRALKRTELRLERPLRIAIVGEFNSGKSSLANLLARIESLPTAIVSSTRIPTLLYHAPQPQIWAVHIDGRRKRLRANRGALDQSIFRLEVGLPSPRLRAMQILDLPGLADPRFDASLADLVVHNVDAVLWCTVSTQAWKESERAVWEQISPRLQNRGLLVTTHCDHLRAMADKEKLLARLCDEAGPSFNAIVLLSTTEALAVMQRERDGPAKIAWEASGADALDAALDSLLQGVRQHRNETALEMVGRIAYQTLARLERSDAPAA